MGRSPGDFDPTSNTIEVMTKKFNKGLILPFVALPGVRHMSAKGESKQEVARVFFVTATKATQVLILGWTWMVDSHKSGDNDNLEITS